MAAAMGVQYFKQVVITWSIRKTPGSVQRTHIMNVTPKHALAQKIRQPQQVAQVVGQRMLGRKLQRMGIVGEAEPFGNRQRGHSSRPKNRIAASPADGRTSSRTRP